MNGLELNDSASNHFLNNMFSLLLFGSIFFARIGIRKGTKYIHFGIVIYCTDSKRI